MTQSSIAMLVDEFPNAVQTYVLSQIAAFKDAGAEVSVIACGKRSHETLPDVISKYRMLEDVVYINTEPGHLPSQLLSLPVLNASYWMAVWRLLTMRMSRGYEKTYRLKAIIRARALAFRPFEIIHSHSVSTTYNYLFMRELLSIPIVTTYHGQVPRGVNRLEGRKLELVLEKGDAFLVNTGFARDELISQGCRADKIHIIPQGSNLEDFPFRDRSIEPGEKIILLTVARLSIEKGHHVAIDAVRELVETYPGLEYHIVGDGPCRESLSDQVSRLGLQDRVIFHGFKAGAEFEAIFASAHIFILPSIDTGDGYHVETQGVVLQEAQGRGIPVIGSRTGGIPEVIDDNVSGLLYSEGDHSELADRIRQLIADKDLYHRLAESGRRDVENRFDINVIAARQLELYHNILEK
jgi:colanic acid/amylovoran biosynthesis glycosyltransferase